ncbi:MAG: SDR family oxidoreductase [Brucellaceae bacterium]|nr:SDR family oxidoreductase [Brucellaceae bacterium]
MTDSILNDDLAGKVALVTGGTSGIGRTICDRLAREGAVVCFTGRRAEQGRAIAEASGQHFFTCDNTSEDDIVSAAAKVRDEVGPVAILVNNAGNSGPGDALENITAEAYDETMDTHLRGSFLMVRSVIPQMRENGGGSIVNIGSVAGSRVGGHSPVYAMAKAGLSHLTRWAAMELGPDNIRVNSVSPGFIPTDIHGLVSGRKSKSDPALVGEMMAGVFQGLQPLGVRGSTADVAEAVVYLAGNRAKFVTGIDLVVDGGLSLGRKALLRPSRGGKSG